jgi:hypothetical protein
MNRKAALAIPLIFAVTIALTGCAQDDASSSGPPPGTGSALTDTGTPDAGLSSADAAGVHTEDTAGVQHEDAAGPSPEDTSGTPSEDTVEPPGEDTGTPPAPLCEGAGEVLCIDEIYLDFSLHDDKVSAGAVTNTADGDEWVSAVDATAGGMNASTANPWTYVRFSTNGLVKVEIDDDTALSSTEWDVAMKRFNIRLNSGVSGPGCTLGMEVRTTVGSTAALPSSEELLAEAFYTEDCTLVEDDSGLPGAPASVMAGWWLYAGCVATTGKVFGIRGSELDVAVTVESYYESGQDACNAGGAPGSGSGNLKLRWRAL